MHLNMYNFIQIIGSSTRAQCKPVVVKAAQIKIPESHSVFQRKPVTGSVTSTVSFVGKKCFLHIPVSDCNIDCNDLSSLDTIFNIAGVTELNVYKVCQIWFCAFYLHGYFFNPSVLLV